LRRSRHLNYDRVDAVEFIDLGRTLRIDPHDVLEEPGLAEI